MTIRFSEMGPGVLRLGSGLTRVDAQIRSCAVDASESVTRTDRKPVLSGEALPARERADYTYTLVAKVIQDFIDTGVLVDWSWDNKGTDQDFVFCPNNDEGRAVWGICQPAPIKIGGDVEDTSPESDFTWRIVGEPTRGSYNPVTGEVTEDV